MVEPKPHHGAGPEVVGYHVAGLYQLQEKFLAPGVDHFQAQAGLVPRPEVGQRPAFVPPFLARLPVRERAGTAVLHVVNALNPDDLSPEVGQKRCTPGQSVHLLQGKDPYSIQNAHKLLRWSVTSG